MQRKFLLLGVMLLTTFNAASAQAPRTGEVGEVTALVETEPVPEDGDAADDSAIWIHPTDPSQSTIIGTDKTTGLAVYNLDGSVHQQVNNGRMNNVDLRYNFPLDGERVAIVVATDRSDDSLAIFRVNPETRDIEDVAADDLEIAADDVYGLCMYHSHVSGKYYAILNEKEGIVEQYELSDNGEGLVDVTLMRTFEVDSQPEGCVADDELGFLYVGEENIGIWKFDAEPDAATEPLGMVDDTSDSGNLTDDVEGLAIYYANDQRGYLLASSQGSDEFVIYAREGDNAYIGTFIVAGNATVDRVSGTDGIDVTNFPLGDAFPEGLFVAQDDENTRPDGNQNFKLVSWEDIAEVLGLTSDTAFDPRSIGAE